MLFTFIPNLNSLCYICDFITLNTDISVRIILCFRHSGRLLILRRATYFFLKRYLSCFSIAFFQNLDCFNNSNFDMHYNIYIFFLYISYWYVMYHNKSHVTRPCTYSMHC